MASDTRWVPDGDSQDDVFQKVQGRQNCNSWRGHSFVSWWTFWKTSSWSSPSGHLCTRPSESRETTESEIPTAKLTSIIGQAAPGRLSSQSRDHRVGFFELRILELTPRKLFYKKTRKPVSMSYLVSISHVMSLNLGFNRAMKLPSYWPAL